MAAIDITGAGGGGISNVTGTSPVVVTIVGTARDVSLDQTQFKTINGNSIFGAGNIVISAGLTNWTEAFNSGTQATSSFTATNAATNVNAALVAKGTGAIVAQIPNGAATGGNARGQYAVDFQMQRSNANQVASGNTSVICGGAGNLNADTLAFIGGGDDIQIGSTTLGRNIVVGGVTQRINAGTGGRNYIGGGEAQTISGTSRNSIIGSGGNHSINAIYSGIFSGQGNTNNAAYSVITGGELNTISGNYHSVVGRANTISGSFFHSHIIGNANTASNNLVFLIGTANTGTAQMSVAIGDSCSVTASNTLGTGSFSSAYLQGQKAHANGRFTITGDAQGGEAILRHTSGFTDAQTKEIYLDGSSLRITGPTNSAMTVNIDIVAIVTAISGTATGVTVGDMFSQNEICAYKNIAGTGTNVGSHSIHKIHDTSMAACDTSFATTGAALQVFFTGPNFAGGGTVTLRIVAKARIVETRY